jgi:hypothetical protein
MQPSELQDLVTRALVRRGGAATLITMSDDWVMTVKGANYDVHIVLSPEQRSVESALAAVRRVLPWAMRWDEPSVDVGPGDVSSRRSGKSL